MVKRLLPQDLEHLYQKYLVNRRYYMEQYSVKDIKEILHMNENTIRTNLYRARQKIKNNYEGGM